MTDVAANRVVVAGTADAGALKTRLEAKLSKPVDVISAGGAPKKLPAVEPKQDAGAGEKGDKGVSPKDEEKEKKQQAAEEKKSKQVGKRQAMPPTQPNYSSDLSAAKKRLCFLFSFSAGDDGAAQDPPPLRRLRRPHQATHLQDQR